MFVCLFTATGNASVVHPRPFLSEPYVCVFVISFFVFVIILYLFLFCFVCLFAATGDASVVHPHPFLLQFSFVRLLWLYVDFLFLFCLLVCSYQQNFHGARASLCCQNSFFVYFFLFHWWYWYSIQKCDFKQDFWPRMSLM